MQKDAIISNIPKIHIQHCNSRVQGIHAETNIPPNPLHSNAQIYSTESSSKNTVLLNLRRMSKQESPLKMLIQKKREDIIKCYHIKK